MQFRAGDMILSMPTSLSPVATLCQVLSHIQEALLVARQQTLEDESEQMIFVKIRMESTLQAADIFGVKTRCFLVIGFLRRELVEKVQVTCSQQIGVAS